MVLEFGDIDLARLLLKREKARKEAGIAGVDGHFIRLYWQQMLQVTLRLQRPRCLKPRMADESDNSGLPSMALVYDMGELQHARDVRHACLACDCSQLPQRPPVPQQLAPHCMRSSSFSGAMGG